MSRGLTKTIIKNICVSSVLLLTSITITLSQTSSIHAQKSDADNLKLPTVATVETSPSEEYQGYIKINDIKGLQAIAEAPDGKYILMSDISLAGMDWSPINFSGTFDGNGHTIFDLKSTQLNPVSNISVDGNDKKYETYFSGLFGQARNAVIKNLNIKACDIKISTDKNCFAACLAGYTENTEITNCSVQGSVYLYSKNIMCGVAGVTGFGYGTVAGCKTDVTLVIVDESDKSLKCEQFLGGILGSGYSDIENCNVKMRGYASIHGYAHNGGIVGMHYIHTSDNRHAGYVRKNTVDGVISFFENNKDRRAYCAAYIGETLNSHVTVSGNTTISFKRDEHYDFNTTLLPDMCASPVYSEIVKEATCTEMGYTTYTCKNCGYSYNANHTFAGHKAGEFKTVLLPTYSEEGKRTSYCTVCGAIVNDEKIPKLVYSASCILENKELNLHYKSHYSLSASYVEENTSQNTTGNSENNSVQNPTENGKFVWTSSDESIATVDSMGNIKATGRGTAMIKCSMPDGTMLGESTVTVKYSFGQWLIVIILFGWLWY